MTRRMDFGPMLRNWYVHLHICLAGEMKLPQSEKLQASPARIDGIHRSAFNNDVY
jgi:hypothetical protein